MTDLDVQLRLRATDQGFTAEVTKAERARDAATRALDDIRIRHLEAAGDMEAATRARVAREIASLSELRLSEEGHARATVMLRAIAEAEITEARRREEDERARIAERAAAAAERDRERMIRDVTDPLRSFGGELIDIARAFGDEGVSAAERFASALDNLVGRALDRILEKAFDAGFDGLSKAFPETFSALGGLFGADHTGGIVGHETAFRRLSPLAFAGAGRYHDGGLVPGEVPITARAGEGVFTPRQMDAADQLLQRSMQPPQIIVRPVTEIRAAGVQSRSETSRDDQGDIEIRTIIEQVSNELAGQIGRGENRGLNGALRGVYGLQPVGAR